MKELTNKQVLKLSPDNVLAHFHQKRLKEQEKRYKKAHPTHNNKNNKNKNKNKK